VYLNGKRILNIELVTFIKNRKMTPINLIALHTILVEMVKQDRIDYEGAINFLRTAGMIKRAGGEGWIDENNVQYDLPLELKKEF
jgi:hypothetical protein